MIQRVAGEVISVIESNRHMQRLVIRTDDGRETRGINYPSLSGICHPGNRVLLNSTAQALALGSGGWDFVIAVLDGDNEQWPDCPGHLMKLRYTPMQIKVLAWDEEQSPHQPDEDETCGDLAGTPVLIIGVHSILEPIARALIQLLPGSRIAYIMTDGACLPVYWSQTVTDLRCENVLCATITSGHAFGGEYEALTNYSALACAKSVVAADFIVIGMGPGIPGTGSRYGSTGLEVGEIINSVTAMNGRPVAVPRFSMADSRPRHRGIAHHFITALHNLALSSAIVPIPCSKSFSQERMELIVTESGLDRTNRHGVRHQIHYIDVDELIPKLSSYLPRLRTMGRSYQQDPLHFDAGFAAAQLGASMHPIIPAGP